MIVVAAYGKILPEEVLTIPPYGCVNVHGSLLPKYRGAAPIQWTILNGEPIAGVTTMRMAKGLDTGDIFLTAQTPVDPEETAGELFDRLKLLGADLLIETLRGLELGTLTATPQNEALATHAPMLKKEMSHLDWSLPAKTLHDRIRGLDPWPCAVAYRQGNRLRLFGSRVLAGTGDPGLLEERNGELVVYCGDGALQLCQVQLDGGRRMTAKEYLRGHPLVDGEHFT